MGDHQGRPGAVNLGPVVIVDLNLWKIVCIAVITLIRTKINKTTLNCDAMQQTSLQYIKNLLIKLFLVMCFVL